jgi:hypothetical protein
MPLACWPVGSRGRYVVDVAVSGIATRCAIDLGLTDPLDKLGFELEPALYDQLRRSGGLSHLERRERLDSGGRRTVMSTGLLTAQLIDPLTRQVVGPRVAVYAARGAPGLSSRVGVVFFHRLSGCRVVWELDTRTWCVEYP